jgi:hypothetical protein
MPAISVWIGAAQRSGMTDSPVFREAKEFGISVLNPLEFLKKLEVTYEHN